MQGKGSLYEKYGWYLHLAPNVLLPDNQNFKVEDIKFVKFQNLLAVKYFAKGVQNGSLLHPLILKKKKKKPKENKDQQCIIILLYFKVLLLGIDELTNIRNVELLKRDLRVGVRY